MDHGFQLIFIHRSDYKALVIVTQQEAFRVAS